MALPLSYQKKQQKFFIFTTSRFLYIIKSSETSSINETTAALFATAILFSFLNLGRDSAPAVMVTDLRN